MPHVLTNGPGTNNPGPPSAAIGRADEGLEARNGKHVNDEGDTMSGFEIKKVVREFVEVKLGDGPSHGELLDQLLTEAAHQGGEVMQIKFMMEPTEWFALAKALREPPKDEWGGDVARPAKATKAR